jgi:hypothetical protein
LTSKELQSSNTDGRRCDRTLGVAQKSNRDEPRHEQQDIDTTIMPTCAPNPHNFHQNWMCVNEDGKVSRQTLLTGVIGQVVGSLTEELGECIFAGAVETIDME